MEITINIDGLFDEFGDTMQDVLLDRISSFIAGEFKQEIRNKFTFDDIKKELESEKNKLIISMKSEINSWDKDSLTLNVLQVHGDYLVKKISQKIILDLMANKDFMDEIKTLVLSSIIK